MSEVVTILAKSKDEAYAILEANYENFVVRISSEHDSHQFISAPPAISNIDQHMPTNRLNSFTAVNPVHGEQLYILTAMIT